MLHTGMQIGNSSKQRHKSEEGLQSIENVSLTFQFLCQPSYYVILAKSIFLLHVISLSMSGSIAGSISYFSTNKVTSVYIACKI